MDLELTFLNPSVTNEDGKEIPFKKISTHLKDIRSIQLQEVVRKECEQGKLVSASWDDNNLSDRGGHL